MPSGPGHADNHVSIESPRASPEPESDDCQEKRSSGTISLRCSECSDHSSDNFEHLGDPDEAVCRDCGHRRCSDCSEP
jgi:DNA-directed RNA polymerase subunit RPC12/RpoP